MTTPPVCDYEESDYQESFWERGGREYEDRCEAIALRRLLPKTGKLMLELGAGAGRNTKRYTGFERIVLLDYSLTQLQQAHERLGRNKRYTFVAANVYQLPFVDELFDAATMIRTLHHMAEPQRALEQVHKVLSPGAAFILEFANKQNLKAVLRWLLGSQDWSPFSPEPIEFAALNFDFHPKAVRSWLTDTGFVVKHTLTVSHFRLNLFKRLVPANILANVDALFQWTGALFQFTPSVFMACKAVGDPITLESGKDDVSSFFKCPACNHSPLATSEQHLTCPHCKRKWSVRDGIFDFRTEA